MVITTNEGTKINEVPDSNTFDLDAYLSSIHNEDGSPLTTQQRDKLAQAIKTNGLGSLSIKKDGKPTMSLIVPPLAHTSTSNGE